MPRYDDRHGNNRLYVGHLSSRTRTRDLEKLFSRYGRVRDVDMKNDFAFVEFGDPRDADDARYSLDGREFEGRRIVVEFSRGVPRSSRDRDLVGRGPPPGSGRCFNCGLDGHWARDCKAGDWKNKCYRCGERGHIERQCKNSPKDLKRADSHSRSPVRSRSPHRGRSRSRSYSRERSYRDHALLERRPVSSDLSQSRDPNLLYTEMIASSEGGRTGATSDLHAQAVGVYTGGLSSNGGGVSNTTPIIGASQTLHYLGAAAMAGEQRLVALADSHILSSDNLGKGGEWRRAALVDDELRYKYCANIDGNSRLEDARVWRVGDQTSGGGRVWLPDASVRWSGSRDDGCGEYGTKRGCVPVQDRRGDYGEFGANGGGGFGIYNGYREGQKGEPTSWRNYLGSGSQAGWSNHYGSGFDGGRGLDLVHISSSSVGAGDGVPRYGGSKTQA